jgi:hypothetical protein
MRLPWDAPRGQKAQMRNGWLELVKQRCARQDKLHIDDVYRNLDKSLSCLRREASIATITRLLDDWRQKQCESEA